MKKFEERILLGLILGFYFYLSAKHFWIFPAPSDQLEYVQSIHWGTSVGGYWPWLDRVGFGAILGLIGWIPLPIYKAAPFYGMLVTCGTLTLGSFWLLARYGFGAALFFLALMISSHYVYHFATEIYPEPTLIFFLFLTVILLIGESSENRRPRLFFAGLALSFAALCKIVVLPISILIAAHVFYQNRFMNNWRHFAAGLGVGLALIFGLFVATYGWASWVDMFVQFYIWNFTFMLKGNPGVNNIVSYYQLFVDRGYLPIFIALFVSLGLYRNRESKRFATLAWILGGTICAVYIIGNRPGSVIANYMYPMFFFSVVALSIYWGRLVNLQSIKQKRLAAFFVLAGLCLGWVFGSRHNTEAYFQVGYYKEATFALKAMLAIGTFVLAGIPTLLELYPVRRMALLCLAAISFFSMLYNGGRAKTDFVESLLPEVDYFYSNAPLLDLIPSKDFYIYNSHWNNQARAHRVVTVYTHFFNSKFELPEGPERQKYAMEVIPNKVRLITKAEEISKVQSNTLVTDLVQEVLQVYPQAKVTATVPWKGYELQVMTLRP